MTTLRAGFLVRVNVDLHTLPVGAAPDPLDDWSWGEFQVVQRLSDRDGRTLSSLLVVPAYEGVEVVGDLAQADPKQVGVISPFFRRVPVGSVSLSRWQEDPPSCFFLVSLGLGGFLCGLLLSSICILYWGHG